MSDDLRQWSRIYLTYCDGSHEQPVLWCQDRVDDSDVEYVNIAAFDAQAERVAKLETMLVSLQWCVENVEHGIHFCPICFAARGLENGHHPGRTLAALLPKEICDG